MYKISVLYYYFLYIIYIFLINYLNYIKDDIFPNYNTVILIIPTINILKYIILKSFKYPFI